MGDRRGSFSIKHLLPLERDVAVLVKIGSVQPNNSETMVRDPGCWAMVWRRAVLCVRLLSLVS